MKTCPQCGSVVFDDLDTCYGCMFRFDVKGTGGQLPLLDDPPVSGAAGLAKEEGRRLQDGEGSWNDARMRDDESADGGGPLQARTDASVDTPSSAVAMGVCGGREPMHGPAAIASGFDADAFTRVLAPDANMAGVSMPPIVVIVQRDRDDQETCHLLTPHTQLAIGRSLRNDIVLTSPDVSRLHARVGFDEDRVWVEDLGSSNHTYVHGIAISGREHVSDGEEFSICETRFRIHMPMLA